MNRERLDLIPDKLLRPGNGSALCEWLHARGWQLSLLDLDTERRQRGLLSQRRKARRGSGS